MGIRSIDRVIESVRDYSESVIHERAQEIDREGKFPEENFRHLADLGVLRIPFRRQYGGLDGELQDILRVIRLISQECASTASVLLTQISFGITPIHDYGTEEQRNRYLVDLYNGEEIAAFAMNELHSGSDVEEMKTVAIETESGWELNGMKDYISLTGKASLFSVAAQVTRLNGEKDYGILLVPADTPGVEWTEKKEKMGIRGLPVGDLVFNQVKLEKDALLGGKMGGKQQIQSIKDYNKLFVAAQALGIALGAFQETLTYMQKDRRFGQRLIDLLENQNKMAVAYSEIYASQALVESILFYNPEDVRLNSLVKLKTSNLAVDITEMAIALTGGYGYMGGSSIERYVRDAKLTQIYGGGSQTQMKNLAKPWLTTKNNKENNKENH